MGYLYALVTAFIWGSCAVVSKLTLATMSVAHFFFLSCSMAILWLLIILHVTKRMDELKSMPVQGIVNSASMGVFGFFLTSIFLLNGYNYLPTQLVVILTNSWPVWLIILHLLNKYVTFSLNRMCSVLLGFTGICVAVGFEGAIQIDISTVIGISLVSASAVSSALFAVIDTHFNYDALSKLFIAYVAAWLCSIPMVILEGAIALPTLSEWAGILWLGGVGYALSYICWIRAHRLCNSYTLINIMYLTPCVSLVLCVFILGETLAIASALGLAIVTAALYMQQSAKAKHDA